MLAINVIYDGKKVKLLEKPNVKATAKTPRRAILTFLDEDTALNAAKKKTNGTTAGNDTEKKKKILRQLTQRFKTYTIPANAPLKFTRDELHDRR